MIGSQLQQELMNIIMRELNDPRIDGFPSITRVEVSSDLSSADVYVTIMGSEGKQSTALNALKHSAGLMRQKLQKSLPLRTIPFLKFQLDEALRKELDVLNLIDQAVKEEDARKAKHESQDDQDTNSPAADELPETSRAAQTDTVESLSTERPATENHVDQARPTAGEEK